MADYAIHDTTLSGIANVIRKKDGTSALIDPADYEDRIDLMGMLEEKTASGSVVVFEDGADDVKLKSYVATIDPTLTGTDSVDVVQTGRNLLEIDSSYDISARATTLTRDYSNNVLHIYGEIQDTNSNYYSQDITDLVREMGTVTIIANTVSGGTADLSFRVNVQDGSTVISRLGIGDTARTITYTEGYTYLLMFFVSISATVGNTVDMIVNFEADYGSSVGSYEPYVTPTTQTADLEQTIYGGSVDVANGTGSDKYGRVVYTGEASENWAVTQASGIYRFYIRNDNVKAPESGRGVVYSSIGTYASTGYAVGTCYSSYSSSKVFIYYVPPQTVTTVEEFKAWLNNTHFDVVYEKATPTDFTFDPVEIRSLLGSNTMWADSGASSVVYRGSGTETVIQPTLISKTITANGTYSAEDDGADGYDEVTVNVSGGGGNAPEASQTLICDNSSYASSLTFTDDYADYDLLKFVLYRSDTAGEFVFYMTPAMVDAMWQYSNNLLNFNQPYGNNFVTYQKSSNTAWTRYGRRNMDIKYVYGLTFTNCTCTETELYNRRGNGSSSVTFVPPTGDSFLDYDYILFATCTGSNDETEPCLDVLRPKAEKDIFGSPNTQQESVMVYKYNSGGSLVTVTSDTITSYAYFYVSGLKLSF